MKTQRPLISVVMPNYNTPEPYLRSAIESVLNQTYSNIELIIVDDASTGGDVAVIESYRDERIVLLRNETNRHVAYSSNRGFECAHGEFIARMDSDDICLPRRFETQVRFLQRRPDIDVVCAQARFFGDRNGVFAPLITNTALMKTELFFCCPIVNPTVMFRADFLKENGIRYDDGLDYKAAEDYELWARCAEAGKICECPKVLLLYRVHNKQVSSKTHSTQLDGTRRVRARLLARLDITPDDREATVHSYLCTANVAPDIPLEETERWARRLIDANGRYLAFHQRFFKSSVIQRFFVVAVKSLLQRRIALRQLLKLPLMKQALIPVYYPDYFKRFLFSKRLNRFIKKSEQMKESL